MAEPVVLLPRYNPEHEDESAAHFFAREAQAILRFLIKALILVTVLMMMVPAVFMWAIIPATVLIICYGLLMVINVIEARSLRQHRRTKARVVAAATPEPPSEAEKAEAPAPSEPPAAAVSERRAAPEPADRPAPMAEPAWRKREVDMPLLRRETILVGAAAVVIFIIATVLGVMAFGWQMILLAAPVFFACLLLGGLPVLFAAVEEDVEHTAQPGERARSTPSAD
jgi:hypothetical protein